MYLSLNWLKNFVDIPKKITPEELALRLTMHTVEIDSVARQADKYKNVVVGKIVDIKKHPNADKLQLVKVKIKTGEQEVVCAASNIKIGQIVPLALVGAILPNGMEIKATEIRGIRSAGMLCAEDELGLGEDHSGIMILEPAAKLGQPLSDYLGLEDVIFEVDNKSINNRPDLWSHYGLAREIAAFLEIELKKINFDDKALASSAGKTKLDIKVEDFKLCPRYMAIAIDGLKIEPSPQWLKDRLIAVGVRPISNIVDITNYVMMELGQPLHAFDQRQVDKIIIRRAKNGEMIETLDNTERKLDSEMLVIADSAKPIAIAGVMGGRASEINDRTTAIIFEAANFDFVAIRKTSQKLGLRTEASVRYEKSLDPNLCDTALAHAVALVKEICVGAKIASSLTDEKKFELREGPIELDLLWLNNFIGEKIKEKKVVTILESLGFTVASDGKKLKVTVPSWRATKDISIKEDVAEEITRIYGYDNLKPTMPKVEMKAPPANEARLLERKMKNFLSGAGGLTEVYNYSFTSGATLKKMGLDDSEYISLTNPVSLEGYLRGNLAVNLFGNIKVNQAKFEKIGLFEIGSVFLRNMSGEIGRGGSSGDKLPYQEKKVGIILAGANGGELFMEIKSIINGLLSYFDLSVNYNVIEAVPYWADNNESAKILVGKRMIGTIFKLGKKAADSLGFKKPCVLAELSFNEFYKIVSEQGVIRYSEHEKYPPVIRDLGLVIPEKILYNDVRAEIANWHEFIESAELFDVFFGEKIGVGKKNMAFRIIYRTNRTLTAAEVDKIQDGLIAKLTEKFGAKIRDF